MFIQRILNCLECYLLYRRFRIHRDRENMFSIFYSRIQIHENFWCRRWDLVSKNSSLLKPERSVSLFFLSREKSPFSCIEKLFFLRRHIIQPQASTKIFAEKNFLYLYGVHILPFAAWYWRKNMYNRRKNVLNAPCKCPATLNKPKNRLKRKVEWRKENDANSVRGLHIYTKGSLAG